MCDHADRMLLIVVWGQPVIFGANEGFLIRNDIVFPATGVARIAFNIAWSEVPGY